jgi:NAD(P)H-dependent glutamate synthase small subunit
MNIDRSCQRGGLYDPRFEHDSCGVGFVARIDGNPTHDIVRDSIRILCNLEHRGAVGADGATGDGAGLTMNIPDGFYRASCSDVGLILPESGDYALAMMFLPVGAKKATACMRICEDLIEEEGCEVIGWREVPVRTSQLGALARESQPDIRQLFLSRGKVAREDFERKLYVIRRMIENRMEEILPEIGEDFYIVSMSARSVNYKGYMNGKDLPGFYEDLTDERFACKYALIHQRYSTNTFPSWRLAQPFRFCAHNGEINTLRGNINHMLSRESDLVSELFGDDIEKIKPIIMPGGSDSAALDNLLELLVFGGRSLPHAVMMMVPEAWGAKHLMGEDKRAFYEYHASVMEPWDGPAALTFSDGRYVGGVLDRNGLRPARYTITKDGLVVLASEVGVLDIPDENVRTHGRLQPGKMFLIDLEHNRVVPDNIIKATVSRQKPYRNWVKSNRIELRGLSVQADIPPEDPASLRRKQIAFGYSEEDLKMIIAPMAARGQEPVGSMGDDTSLAVLSSQPQLLFNYFKQLFAQVTNPPIDPLREELVMSLMRFSGKEQNLLDETPEHCRQLKLHHPVLTPEDMKRIRGAREKHLKVVEIDTLFSVQDYGGALQHALEACFNKAELAIDAGATILILTDRNMSKERAPIPVLLAVAGLHHHLIKHGKRSSASLIVESGEVREIMHFALLIGYGASAVCPHLAFSTIRSLCEDQVYEELPDSEIAADAYITAVKKGLMKTMSRIGISTIRSYFGAQIFEAVGLSKQLVDTYFCGTVSRIDGIGLDELAAETLLRYRRAFDSGITADTLLDVGGNYLARVGGKKHLLSPEAISTLQQAIRTDDYGLYRKYADIINNQDDEHVTLRSLLDFTERAPVPIEEVEPVEEIVKRFATSAMSMGSLSPDAHETLAIAMNRLGGRSNSGEGGEDPARYTPEPGGDSRRSEIKQVASGRFGVTIEYLANASELQIKMAQGAKPGEGGQLPGHKVSAEIARIRHSTPGVTLISPPPHHDIYSIEDLAQLIYDLKMANPKAKVSVKLVSEAGVGTIAAGVVKGKADTVVISGGDGGTGASPLTSIKHAGLPWELGLAETQQTLVMNNLRKDVRVHVDGQLRTGRDIAMAALLGADEFGFGTLALVGVGCVMLRKCHLNACSVGVATQDPELRKNFAGKSEHVINMMRFIARDLREHMAMLGFRTVDEMIGHPELLTVQEDILHYKAKKINFGAILYAAVATDSAGMHHSGTDIVPVETSGLEDRIIEGAAQSLDNGEPVDLSFPIRNIDRTIGTTLSYHIVSKYGMKGLAEDTVKIALSGSAGQSFGAYLAPGVSMRLVGNSNDYFAKGMSGGRIVVVPGEEATFKPWENVIIGNVALYGATSGEVFIYGTAGERFAVRNSGAVAVVEGVGDHGCEYMTGGVVVVLGDTGNNFAAGMSGGTAYIYNEREMFDTRCNLGMVDIESVTAAEDERLLKDLVERYHTHTGSKRAGRILADWDSQVPLFAKVMPVDYKLALERMQREESADADTVSSSEEVFLPSYLEHQRQNPPKRPTEERIKDYQEVERMLSPEELRIQASRCRDCGLPYCHSVGCPVTNRIPDFNLMVTGNSWKQALEILHQCNNFPEITGRVCPAPCETSCTLSINMGPVTIKHIELSIVERGWKNGWITPQPAPRKSGKRIAIIGSGPAGLTAAQQLARAGHDVVVFEKDDRPGGWLRYGIPDFKLEKRIIDRRLDQLRAEGVVFETGVNAGEDLSSVYLRHSFDAMLITIGARVPRDIDVPGRELAGIHFAGSFLTLQNRRNAGDSIPPELDVTADGRNVLVIGGGDTGSDCVGTSRRQGAKTIRQVEIMPMPPSERSEGNPWPEWPQILRTSSSHEEGCERIWSTSATRFDGSKGVETVALTEVEWTLKDGAWTFAEKKGTASEIEADLVLLAMGFVHVEHGPLVKDLGVGIDNRGNIEVDDRYMTSVPGVFAAGDSVSGASLVVRAFDQGRRAAEAVDAWLFAEPAEQSDARIDPVDSVENS